MNTHRDAPIPMRHGHLNNHLHVRRGQRGPKGPNRSRQHGVVLWVALFVLLIMMAATIGVLRSSLGGLSISGNLAFRKSATTAADGGVEQARAWLIGNNAALFSDNAANGYYADWGTGFDPAQFNWAPGVTSVDAGGQTGNTSEYVIHRMCEFSGATFGNVTVSGGGQAPQVCVSPSVGEEDGSSDGFELAGTDRPLYRVTVRVLGPRNTVSFVQAMVF